MTEADNLALSQLRLDWIILGSILFIIWFLRILDGNVLKNKLTTQYGVRPRERMKLFCLLSHAFLHADRKHLISNTVPLIMLGGLAIFFELYYFWVVTLVIILIDGLGTWLFGQRQSNHIGASGLVLGYFGFTLSRGIFEANTAAFLLALFIGAVYRGFFALIIPKYPGVSKVGHFFGFIGGIVAAWFTVWLTGRS
jgi:membrane associated rhomboid family serine protease